MKRGRGRGGRKPSNNMNRTLESNGPDVKVRGTAHQIFDKYQALARDAHASGDRIAYENYLQHAEHYQRIILAAQPAAQETTAARSTEAGASEAGASEEEASETTSETTEAVASEEEDASSEAPRRARRGRRTRSTRGNGRGDADTADDAEAPAETA